MTWNYRVVRDTDGAFSIREAYYDNEGRVEAITEEGIGPYGDTVEELRADYERMREAFEKPVLDAADFMEKDSKK